MFSLAFLYLAFLKPVYKVLGAVPLQQFFSLTKPPTSKIPLHPKAKSLNPKARNLTAKTPLICTVESLVQEAGRHTVAISSMSISPASSFI
jgi:hypothetical protein